MENHQHHVHTCTCACTNPVVNMLKDRIFSDEHLLQLKATLPASAPAASTPQAMVYTGGTIRPMINGETGTVEAIGFAEGKVIASGSLADVQAAMDQSYEGKYSLMNLQGGQTLLPGLFEPHVHVVYSGIMAAWVDVSPFNGQDLIGKDYTISYVQDVLNKALAKHPDQALLATGLDPALLCPNSCSNFSEITVGFLDPISDKVPILIMSASGHTLYANSAALTRTYDFPANIKLREQYSSAADYISATKGILEEQTGIQPAMDAHWYAIAKTTLHMAKNLDAFFAEANSRGVTSMYDAMLDNLYLSFLKPYIDLKGMTVRLGGAKYCEKAEDVHSLPTFQQPSSYNDIYYGHVKIVSDGSNQGLTGYQSQPYACDSSDCGIFNFKDTDDFQKLVNAAMIDKGWPLMIHANGDQAVTDTISAYSTALSGHDTDNWRNRIEHCSLLSADRIQAMAAFNISPSFLIGHVGYWGYAFQNVIFQGQMQNGQPKVEMLDLCRSALSQGLRISLHSDHTVTPLGPLRMMEQSITRVMEGSNTANDVLNQAEQLTAEQALKAVTYDAAWQCYADGWAGSLVEGHYADFIILAQDPLTMPADKISMNMRNIEVESTWLGGVMVYSAGSAKAPEQEMLKAAGADN